MNIVFMQVLCDTGTSFNEMKFGFSENECIGV